MNRHLVSIIIIIALFHGCTKTAVEPINYDYWPYDDDKSIETNIPSVIRPMLPTGGIPVSPQVAKYVVNRFGVTGKTHVTSITGSLPSEVPTDLVKLFTQGNLPLAQLTSSDSLNGWLVKNVKQVGFEGTVYDRTALLNDTLVKSLSGVFSYFPDGYYIFVSNIDQKYNDLGWYQVSLQDNLPIGIVFKSLASGQDFKSPPRNANVSPTQVSIFGYGIWGIDKNVYLPLVQVDKYLTVFLYSAPIKY